MSNTNTNIPPFSQTNAYAMLHGLLVGVWSVAVFTVFVWSLSNPALSTLYLFAVMMSPVLVIMTTIRFRREVAEANSRFTFGRGFSHTLLVSVYGSLWLAIAIFVYLTWLDHGFIFDAYTAQWQTPEMIDLFKATELDKQIAEATGGLTPVQMIDAMRQVSPPNYAVMAVYGGFMAGMPLALIGGLLCRRSPRYAG